MTGSPAANRSDSQPIASASGSPSMAPNVPGANGTRPTPNAVARKTVGANHGTLAVAAGEPPDSAVSGMPTSYRAGEVGMISHPVPSAIQVNF